MTKFGWRRDQPYIGVLLSSVIPDYGTEEDAIRSYDTPSLPHCLDSVLIVQNTDRSHGALACPDAQSFQLTILLLTAPG